MSGAEDPRRDSPIGPKPLDDGFQEKLEVGYQSFSGFPHGDSNGVKMDDYPIEAFERGRDASVIERSKMNTAKVVPVTADFDVVEPHQTGRDTEVLVMDHRMNGQDQENEKSMRYSKHEERRGLLILMMIELFDLCYDLTVFLNFHGGELADQQPWYTKIYSVVMCLSTLATFQLVRTQWRGVRQINEELDSFESTNNKIRQRNVSMKTERINIVRSANVAQRGVTLEQQLGTCERQMRNIKAFIWCAVIEDGLNLSLLLWRVISFSHAGDEMLEAANQSSAPLYVIDLLDLIAVAIGCAIIGYKLSYIRDFRRAKRGLRQITKALMREARKCKSILDSFEDVKKDEVNQVVAVRTILENDLRNQPEHVRGDLNILWQLRSCKHSIHKTCERMRGIVKYRRDHNMDEVFFEVVTTNRAHFDPSSPLSDGTCCLGPSPVDGNLVIVNSLNESFNKSVDVARKWLRYKVEWESIVRTSLQMKHSKIIGTYTLVRLEGLSLRLNNLPMYQIFTKMYDKTFHGLGVEDVLQKTYFIGVNESGVAVYNAIRKILPNSQLFNRSAVIGKDLSPMIAEVGEIAREFRDRTAIWNPKVLDVAGHHVLLSLLHDVKEEEYDLVQKLELKMPELVARIGPIPMLNFLRLNELKIDKTINVVEKHLKWVDKTENQQLLSWLKENNYTFENPSPNVEMYRKAMGVKVCGFSNNRLLVVISCKDICTELLTEIGTQKFQEIYAEDQYLTGAYLDKVSYEKRRLMQMLVIFDVRQFPLAKGPKIAQFLAAQGKLEQHFPERVGKPIIIFGGAQSFSYFYDSIVKPMLPSKVAEKIIILPSDKTKLAQYVNLTTLPNTFFD